MSFMGKYIYFNYCTLMILAIYLIGFIICFIGLNILNSDHSFDKILSYLLTSCLSWVSIFILLIAYIHDVTNSES